MAQVLLAPGNDARFPTAGEKAALAGSSGTPGAGNKFLTAADPALAKYASAGTFTADQRVDAKLGINKAPAVPLDVLRSDTGTAVSVDAATQALFAQHTSDHAGAVYDLVNLRHKSTGDAIFAAHQGGLPAGSGLTPGGNATFNSLIPYYLSSLSTGRNAADANGFPAGTLNDHTGMKAVQLVTQATGAGIYSAYIDHWGGAPAIYVKHQDTAQPQGGSPAGQVDMFQSDDFGSGSTFSISKKTTPASGKASFQLGTTVASAIDMLRINDSAGAGRLLARADGQLVLGLNYNNQSPFAAKLHVNFGAAGVQRNIALSNSNAADNDGCQIEFDTLAAQFGLIQGVFTGVAAGSGDLRFSTRNANTMREYLRLDGANDRVQIFRKLLLSDIDIVLGTTTGTKIGTATSQKLGFFNATPVVQPSGTPADATDLATAVTLVNNLKAKLVSLGLIA